MAEKIKTKKPTNKSEREPRRSKMSSAAEKKTRPASSTARTRPGRETRTRKA
jgi:hypothetical protein